MKRLTVKHEDGSVTLHTDTVLADAIRRLAQYEDSQLSPEMVWELGGYTACVLSRHEAETYSDKCPCGECKYADVCEDNACEFDHEKQMMFEKHCLKYINWMLDCVVMLAQYEKAGLSPKRIVELGIADLEGRVSIAHKK